jgi:hypothetical protein
MIRQDGREAPSVAVELRTAAPAPSLAADAATMRALPAATERFLVDRFGFRHELIGLNNRVTLFGLGVSPVDDLVLGKHGWVFYDENDSIAAGRGLRPLTGAELEAWRCVLEARRDWLAARGVAYVFVVAPDKHTIYADYLPDHLAPVVPRTRLDQLLAHMAAHSSVTVLDLRPALAAARRAHPVVYYPHGTHWNDLGAWAAYRAVMEHVHRLLPDVAPAWREDPPLVPAARAKESWDRRLHIDGRLTSPEWTIRDPEPAWRLVHETTTPPRQRVTEIPGSPTPRVVLFHDSFAVQWRRWMSHHVGHVAYRWQDELERAFVAHERPALVVQELVERHLWPPPVDPSPEVVEQATSRAPLPIPPRPGPEPAPCADRGAG